MGKVLMHITFTGRTQIQSLSNTTSNLSTYLQISLYNQMQQKNSRLHQQLLNNLCHSKYHPRYHNKHHSHLNHVDHNVHQNCRNSCNKLHKVNSLPVTKLTKIILQMMRKLTSSLHSSKKWRMTPSHSPKLKRTGTGHTGKKPWMRRSLHLTMLAHEAMSQGQHTRIS